MKKIVGLILSLPLWLLAEQLEITSKSFEADEKKGTSVFYGDVRIKKGIDEINASKVVVYFDEKKKPTKYEAIGDVTFLITLENKKSYQGYAGTIIYEPTKKLYTFLRDVFIEERAGEGKIYGDMITVDAVSGSAKVAGKKDKPVKFIFNVEEKGGKEPK